MRVSKRSLASMFAMIAGMLVVLHISGCVFNKPSVSLEGENEEAEFDGVVTNKFQKEGCDWLIKYEEGAEDKFLIPVALDDEFKKDGLKVEFRFHLSRISQGDCQMGQPAVIEHIVAK